MGSSGQGYGQWYGQSEAVMSSSGQGYGQWYGQVREDEDPSSLSSVGLAHLLMSMDWMMGDKSGSSSHGTCVDVVCGSWCCCCSWCCCTGDRAVNRMMRTWGS